MYKKLGIKPSRLAANVLKAIGVAGIVIAVLTMPGLGIVIHEFQKSSEEEQRKRLYQSIQYLKRRGHVAIKYLSNKRLKITLTKKGKTIVNQLAIEELQIKKPAIWDKKWRMVIFDVPNWKNKNRLAFTDNLKHIGFRMMQKSVWAYPYTCYDEIMILRKFYDIEKYVIYLDVGMVEDDYVWRRCFSHLRLN